MSNLHCKKDGTLDMRYSSSRQAAASFQTPAMNFGSSSSAATSSYGLSGGGMHYKKDGTLDMRYTSSKLAAASQQQHSANYGSRPAAAAAASSHGLSGDGLHYKKDGTLDMRYTSSKLAAAEGQACRASASSAGNPAGTAAYMGPELLGSTKQFEFNCDVYSYGILLNELISEEQPYSSQMHCFGGRGPFGAANYARMGNRPTIARNIVDHLSDLIKQCWHADPNQRPTFEKIMRSIEDKRFVVPNGGGLQGHSWQ